MKLIGNLCLVSLILIASTLIPSFAGAEKVSGVIKDWKQAIFYLQPDTGSPMPMFNKLDTKYPQGHPNAGERVNVWYYRDHNKIWVTRVEIPRAEGEGPHLNGVIKDWKKAIFYLQPDSGAPTPFFNKPDTKYPNGHPKAGERVRVYYYLEGKNKKPWATRVEAI